MGIKHAPRIATRRSQRGVMLMILILIFAVPVIFAAYLGFVVEPGLALVQNRMSQHQADYSALSLRWECEQHTDCRKLNQNQDTSTPWGWSAPFAQTPERLSERILLSALQFITMSGNAHAETEGCNPPDCLSLSGTKEIRGEGEDKEVYIRFQDDRDIDFNAAAEATMEVGDDGFEPGPVDGSILEGFVGCEKVIISGSSNVRGNVYTTHKNSEIDVSGNAAINGDVVLEEDYTINLGGNNKFNLPANLVVMGKLTVNNDIKIDGYLKVREEFKLTVDVDDKTKIDVGQIYVDSDKCIDESTREISICDGVMPYDYNKEPITCDPIATEKHGEGIDAFFQQYDEFRDLTNFSSIDEFSDFSGGYFKFENFVPQSDLNITGNTVLHVMGDFLLTGNKKITVQGDASLTILIDEQGSLKINSGEISADNVLTTDQRAQVAVLSRAQSADSSDYDVELAANGILKGVLYAPESKVKVRGNQTVASIRAKELDMKGNPQSDELLDYDPVEAGEITVGSFSITTKPFLVK